MSEIGLFNITEHIINKFTCTVPFSSKNNLWITVSTWAFVYPLKKWWLEFNTHSLTHLVPVEPLPHPKNWPEKSSLSGKKDSLLNFVLYALYGFQKVKQIKKRHPYPLLEGNICLTLSCNKRRFKRQYKNFRLFFHSKTPYEKENHKNR